jgi:hypothetical protein
MLYNSLIPSYILKVSTLLRNRSSLSKDNLKQCAKNAIRSSCFLSFNTSAFIACFCAVRLVALLHNTHLVFIYWNKRIHFYFPGKSQDEWMHHRYRRCRHSLRASSPFLSKSQSEENCFLSTLLMWWVEYSYKRSFSGKKGNQYQFPIYIGDWNCSNNGQEPRKQVSLT